MNNHLISLDKLVWEQFEKITIAANKKLGLDKYDLARICDGAAALSLGGMGTYSALQSFIDPSTRAPLNLTLGFAEVTFAYFLYNHTRRKNYKLEIQELQNIIETGASYPPRFFWFRPLYVFGTSGYFLRGGVNQLMNCDSIAPSFFTFLTPREYNTLWGLSTLCMAAVILGEGCSAYFRSQIMTPPTSKKSFWKPLYEGIAEKLKLKELPEPVAEPSSKYSL